MAAPYPSETSNPYPAEPDHVYTQGSYSQGPEIPYPDPTFNRTDTSSTLSTLNEKKRLRMPRAPTRQAREVLEKAPNQQTEYMGMLLHMSTVIEKRPYWNILAAGSTWLMLAGFIVLPGTYTNFQKSDVLKAAQEDQNNLGNRIIASIAHIGLLIAAVILTSIGALGITGLWFKWRQNYIWMINKLILPALLNSTMGLLSTLVSVLSKPQIVWNVTSIGTTAITGGLAVIFLCMFFWYNSYLLEAVKKDHMKAYGDQDVKDSIQQTTGTVIV